MGYYYYLKKDEIIKEGDEVDMCRDGWRDEPKWVKAKNIGEKASDPVYPSHRKYRRENMSKESRIFKVWGIRDRAHLSDKCEIDIVTLLPNCQCSVHYHNKKANKFIVLEGEVIIKTEFGETNLKKGDRIVIEAPLIHQFKTTNKPAIMVEIAYIENGTIDPDDIIRICQGGRVIDGKEMTLVEMRKKGLLDLYDKDKGTK